MRAYLLFSLIAIPFFPQAQTNTFPATGSVGIGTTSPRAFLDVGYQVGDTLSSVLGRLNEGSTTGTGTYLGVRTYGTFPINSPSFSIEHGFYGITNSSITFYRGGDVYGGFMTFSTNRNNEQMRLDQNGNLGIGNANPTTRLLVYQPVAATLTNANTFNTLVMQAGSAMGIGGTGSADAVQSFDSQPLALNPIGNNVLIGKSSQTNTTYKLDIAGNVRANQVTVNTTGADFVFDKGYTLPALKDVAAFIDAHHHLQGIPSAAQMQQEGMSLGETETALLQKVEELTLYAVEADRRAAEADCRAAREHERVEKLEARLDALQLEVEQLKAQRP